MELVDINERERAEIHDALIALLRLNGEGRLRGLTFGLALDNGDYRIGVKGSSRRHPMEALALFARGTSTANNLVTAHLQGLTSTEQ
ncbi:hypothetical protein [Cupriavidus numazuensis]|uniref:hypothetical protein n=1 Tax=Cupriavidus numazuensis TaxID=221992 RepID=UPI001BA97B54|nr:hypothetical protein [Cupriavidus numazuensis]